jgi:hypothetical protein
MMEGVQVLGSGRWSFPDALKSTENKDMLAIGEEFKKRGGKAKLILGTQGLAFGNGALTGLQRHAAVLFLGTILIERIRGCPC